MNRRKFSLISPMMVAVILIASIFIFTACGQSEPDDKQGNAPGVEITVEEAMEIVRQFAGEPLPELTLRETINNPVARLYILKGDSAEYWVNVDSGAIAGVHYTDKIPLSPDVNVSMEEAEAAAVNFAQEMYPGFSGLVLTERQLLDHGANKEYQFVWVQIVDSAVTPNTVNVSVNPVTGEVCSYMSSARDIQPFNPPQVSISEAKTIAESAFQTEKDVSVSEPVLTVTFSASGEQLLVWRVHVDEIVSPSEYQHGVQYLIDAYTKEIIQTTGVY